MILTQERLKEVLEYDQDTGLFTWLIANAQCVKIGDVAGSIDKGYVRIHINNKIYRAHRLAFLYMIGEIPKEIDHINGEKADNRWVNLRACTTTQNQGNQKICKKNTSGYKGVYRNKRQNKWHVRIGKDNKRIHLGFFDCKHEAAIAYNTAALYYFGEFAKINIIRNNKDDKTSIST